MSVIPTNEDASVAAVAGPSALQRQGGTPLNAAIGLSLQSTQKPSLRATLIVSICTLPFNAEFLPTIPYDQVAAPPSHVNQCQYTENLLR